MSSEEFKKVQAELDKQGILTSIVKVGYKKYNLIVNYEIIRVRKQRRSLKNYVINQLLKSNNGN